MAKRVLYTCLGLLLLVLGLQLGTRNVRAQGSGRVECVAYEQNDAYAVVDHHLLLVNSLTSPAYEDLGALPSAARAVACGAAGVVLEDGSVWRWNGPGDWVPLGTFPFSGPLPARKSSWGDLKARFR